MSDRYRRWDGESWCVQCGAVVVAGATPLHDAFHARFNLMYDAIPVSMIETSGHPITATDWQAAHDAGEDEEMLVPERALASETYDRALRDAMEIVERVAGERVRTDGDLTVQILAAIDALKEDK